MKLPTTALIAGLALASVALAAHSLSTPNVSEIVKRSVATNTADWQAAPEYSFCARYIKSKVDGSGQARVEETKKYQTWIIDGSPYERVIEIDNEPLSREQQRQQQMKFAREIAKRQSESASQREARISKYQSQRAEEHMLMQQMIQAFTFTLVGQREVGGVNCYVLDANPNPAYRPPVQKARVLLGMKGQLWIDKENYHWVKVEAEVINPVDFGLFVAKVKPGTKFELEQKPVGDVWLPKHFSESVNVSVFGVYELRSREDEIYSDYQSATNHVSATTTSAIARSNPLARTVPN